MRLSDLGEGSCDVEIDADWVRGKLLEPVVSRFPLAEWGLSENGSDYVVQLKHPGVGTAEVTVQISKDRDLMDVMVGECFQLIDMETDWGQLCEIVVGICDGKVQGSVTRHQGKVVARATRLELSDGTHLYSRSTDMVSFFLPGKVKELVGFRSWVRGVN